MQISVFKIQISLKSYNYNLNRTLFNWLIKPFPLWLKNNSWFAWLKSIDSFANGAISLGVIGDGPDGKDGHDVEDCEGVVGFGICAQALDLDDVCDQACCVDVVYSADEVKLSTTLANQLPASVAVSWNSTEKLLLAPGAWDGLEFGFGDARSIPFHGADEARVQGLQSLDHLANHFPDLEMLYSLVSFLKNIMVFYIDSKDQMA